MAYPRCPISGEVRPVPDKESGILTPQKCYQCRHCFENECTRPEFKGTTPKGIEEAQYKDLDWGPCEIKGGSRLAKVSVLIGDTQLCYVIPSKCAACEFLRYDDFSGLTCNRLERWEHSGIALDWSEIKDEVLEALCRIERSPDYSVDEYVKPKFGSKEIPEPKIVLQGDYTL